MQDYSKVFFQDEYDRLKLAKVDGYRLWGKLEAEGDKKDDLNLRLDFLKEYTRRIETTNLNTAKNFRMAVQARGEEIEVMQYGSYFFEKALESYFSVQNTNIEDESTAELNSSSKLIWKMMHGYK